MVTIPPQQLCVRLDDLNGLARSAKRVFCAVVELGPATHADLQDGTGISDRTIRYALKRLQDEKHIESHASLRDYRLRYFYVHPRHVDGELEDVVVRVDCDGPWPPDGYP